MSFWAAKVMPEKPYTHIYRPRRGRLRLTQATLGDETANVEMGKENVVQLQCTVENKKPVLLCALVPGQSEACHLELEFEEQYVTFSVLGPRSVHLSGYYICDLYEQDTGYSDTASDSLVGLDSDSSWDVDDDDDDDDNDDEVIIPVSHGQITTGVSKEDEDGFSESKKNADRGSKKILNLSNEKSREDRKMKSGAISDQLDTPGYVRWGGKKTHHSTIFGVWQQNSEEGTAELNSFVRSGATGCTKKRGRGN